MSFSGCSGKPSFPPTSAGDLRKLPRVPLRGEGSCGGPVFQLIPSVVTSLDVHAKDVSEFRDLFLGLMGIQDQMLI